MTRLDNLRDKIKFDIKLFENDNGVIHIDNFIRILKGYLEI